MQIRAKSHYLPGERNLKKALLATLALCGFAPAAMADVCETWIDKGHPVTMAACSYPSGGSGYYTITNNGSNAATVCWTVVLNSGKKSTGCYSGLGAGKATNGSCFSCGAKNGGARQIVLDKYKVE